MRDFFNMDNALFRFLGRVADLMILNIAFIIFSLPIFTIGASTTALHYVALKMADNQDGYIFRSFWKSFKQNFRQATMIWLMILAVVIVLVLDIQILDASEGSMMKYLRIAILAVGFIFFMIYLYVFPVLARFYNTIKGTFKNAFLIAVANFPYTILMTVIVIASVVITFFNSYTLWYGLLVWMLGGFALIAFINAQFFHKIFKKYMPEETTEEAQDPDNWNVDETMGTIPENTVDSRLFENNKTSEGTAEPDADAASSEEE